MASLVLTRYLETLLFEVKPVDAAVYSGVAALMMLVAAGASFLPSRRAAAVEPSVDLVAAVPAERARHLGEHLAAVRSDQPVHARTLPRPSDPRGSESCRTLLLFERCRPTA